LGSGNDMSNSAEEEAARIRPLQHGHHRIVKKPRAARKKATKARKRA
jgi:hypothetical protein